MAELPVQPVDEFTDAQQIPRPRMEDIDREVKERDRKRREGREDGELSYSLAEKVGNCNPKQLKRLIKLARRHLKDHKRPPEFWAAHVLFSGMPNPD